MAQLGKATSEVGKSSDASGKAAFEAIAVECEGLSEFLKANADDLQERLARLEIPLPSFGVSEFHEGDNVMEIPRKIRATADSETLTRFLASRVDELNKAGRLAENGQLGASAAERLAEAGPMSLLNAELLRLRF